MQLPSQDCEKKVRYPDVPWLGLPLFRSHVAQLAALEATLGQFASHRTWGALDVEARGIWGGNTWDDVGCMGHLSKAEVP